MADLRRDLGVSVLFISHDRTTRTTRSAHAVPELRRGWLDEIDADTQA